MVKATSGGRHNSNDCGKLGKGVADRLNMEFIVCSRSIGILVLGIARLISNDAVIKTNE